VMRSTEDTLVHSDSNYNRWFRLVPCTSGEEPTFDVVLTAQEPFTMLFTVLDYQSNALRLLEWPRETIPGLVCALPGETDEPSILCGGRLSQDEGSMVMWG